MSPYTTDFGKTTCCLSISSSVPYYESQSCRFNEIVMYQVHWGVHAPQPSSQVGFNESDFAAARKVPRRFSTDYDLESDLIMSIRRGNLPALYDLLLLLLPNPGELLEMAAMDSALALLTVTRVTVSVIWGGR